MIRHRKRADDLIEAYDDGRPERPHRWPAHRVRRFHRCWAVLHGRSLRDEINPAWLARFDRWIACPRCRAHWRERLATHPLTDDVFAWSVDAHAACGGDAITVDVARARWPA